MCIVQIIFAYLCIPVLFAVRGTPISKSINFKKTSEMSFSLRQSINIPAIKALADVLRNPKLCIPDIELSHLRNLDCRFLLDTGIKAIIFDKDNTLRLSIIVLLVP